MAPPGGGYPFPGACGGGIINCEQCLNYSYQSHIYIINHNYIKTEREREQGMHANNRLIYDDAANQSHCDDETAQIFHDISPASLVLGCICADCWYFHIFSPT
jgi:hypothetical protein